MIYGFTKVKEENELMLRASSYISDYTHDGILIADKHLNILFSNQVFENIIGYNLEFLRGKSALTYLFQAANLAVMRQEMLGRAMFGYRPKMTCI